MQTVQSIAFDFAVHGITPRIFGKQGDVNSRTVQISLYNQGAAWPVPDGALLALRYKLPSGASGLYDKIDSSPALTADNNTVSVLLASPIFAEAGAAACELVITDAAGGISTWAFMVLVETASVSDTEIPEDYYNAFLDVASQAAASVADAEAAAKRAEAAAESIDIGELMSKTMYDPTGAVETAGGIPAYVAANAPQGDFIPMSQKGAANGVVPLGSSTKINSNYLYKSTATDFNNDDYVASSSAVKKVYDLVKSETGTGSITSKTGDLSSYSLSVTWKKMGKLVAVNLSGSLTFGAQSSERYFTLNGTLTELSLANAWGVGTGLGCGKIDNVGVASDNTFSISIKTSSFPLAQTYNYNNFTVLYMLP